MGVAVGVGVGVGVPGPTVGPSSSVSVSVAAAGLSAPLPPGCTWPVKLTVLVLDSASSMADTFTEPDVPAGPGRMVMVVPLKLTSVPAPTLEIASIVVMLDILSRDADRYATPRFSGMASADSLKVALGRCWDALVEVDQVRIGYCQFVPKSHGRSGLVAVSPSPSALSRSKLSHVA